MLGPRVPRRAGGQGTMKPFESDEEIDQREAEAAEANLAAYIRAVRKPLEIELASLRSELAEAKATIATLTEERDVARAKLVERLREDNDEAMRIRPIT